MSSNRNQNPSGVKGGAIDLEEGSTRKDNEADLDVEDSPWPSTAAANVLPNLAPLSFHRHPSSPNNNSPDNGFGPDFKDQAHTVKPPPK